MKTYKFVKKGAPLHTLGAFTYGKTYRSYKTTMGEMVRDELGNQHYLSVWDIGTAFVECPPETDEAIVTDLSMDKDGNIIASAAPKRERPADRLRKSMDAIYARRLADREAKREHPLIGTDTAAAPDETTVSFTVPTGYMPLALELINAFNQAARGKGSERHAASRPFDDQPIRNIPRVQGNISGLVYQMMKKANEADMMHERGEHDPAIREFYGVINYAAAAILHIKEREGKDDGN